MATLRPFVPVIILRWFRRPGMRAIWSLSLVFVLALHSHASESVRDELARLQGQTGLHLAWYVDGLQTLEFAGRTATPKGALATPGNGLLSPDGAEVAMPSPGPIMNYPDHLAITKSDATEVHDYQEMHQAVAMCWSHGESKLVVQVEVPDARPLLYNLVIFDLHSKEAVVVAEAAINYMIYTSSQCWSPDDKQLVYMYDSEVRVYDVKNKTSRKVAEGTKASWSPDGRWIAFLNGKGFYAVSPEGTDRKLLFEDDQAFGPLWWSPDCRFVAYLGKGGTFLETLKYADVGLIQVRVRRLADGVADWVYQTPNIPPSASMQAVWLVGKSKEAK